MEKVLPGAVRAARLLILIQVSFIGAMCVASLTGYFMPDTNAGTEPHSLLGVALIATIFAIPTALLMWLRHGLGKLYNGARITCIVLSIIGLLNIPVGTIISGIFLYYFVSHKPTLEAFNQSRVASSGDGLVSQGV